MSIESGLHLSIHSSVLLCVSKRLKKSTNMCFTLNFNPREVKCLSAAKWVAKWVVLCNIVNQSELHNHGQVNNFQQYAGKVYISKWSGIHTLMDSVASSNRIFSTRKNPRIVNAKVRLTLYSIAKVKKKLFLPGLKHARKGLFFIRRSLSTLSLVLAPRYGRCPFPSVVLRLIFVLTVANMANRLDP